MGAQKRRPYTKKRRPYTKEDDQFIARHLGVWSNRQIAAALYRTESGIRYRVKTLGLTPAPLEPDSLEIPEQTSAAPGSRLARLMRLRDHMEGDIYSDDVPMQVRSSLWREYRATLKEIDELERSDDDAAGDESQNKPSFAQAIVALQAQQQKLLEQASAT